MIFPAATMKLTDKTLSALSIPAGKTELIAFDDHVPGFGVRLRAGGSRVWVFQYKFGTRHRRITIGSAKALSASRARTIASEFHAKVRLGQDPQGAKGEGRRAAAETVGAVLQSYLPDKQTTVRAGTYASIERQLLRHCAPLHGLPLANLDRRTIAARLTAIAAKNGPVEANRTRASLSAFFAWCVQQGMLDSNPVVGTGKRPEQSRDRVLSIAELKAIWQATAGADDYSAIVRLLMLCGQRAGEVGALRWSEIVDGSIVLSAARTKNKREHSIPLSPLAFSILEARPRRPGRDFVFGRMADRPFSGWTPCKRALDARLRANGAEVAPWTTHDLRRSSATYMAELGVAPHLIEAILNHVSGHKRGVAGIYNRATYEPAKRQALGAWAAYLMAVVEGREQKVIVPLRGA
jgi:integrase